MADDPGTSHTLNLLCLDGGGIRGLSSLIILQRLMEEIDADDPPKPCDHFDMIGGTSTGGLIAVMLGRLQMSVQEAYDEYIRLAPKIFRKLQHRTNWRGQLQGRYDSEAIEQGVKEILRGKGMEEEALFKGTGLPCRTFVCATRKATSGTYIFSSYPSKRRGGAMRNKAKIWEVVRATSAASSFFDPITIDGLDFVDGGTGANNPLDELWEEATDTFKNGDDWNLEENIGCLISIGTGRPTFKKFDDSVLGIADTLAGIATDTEKKWESFNRQHSSLVKQYRAMRFNVDRGMEDMGLDETQSSQTNRSATETYLESEKIRREFERCVESISKRESSSSFR